MKIKWSALSLENKISLWARLTRELGGHGWWDDFEDFTPEEQKAVECIGAIHKVAAVVRTWKTKEGEKKGVSSVDLQLLKKRLEETTEKQKREVLSRMI